MSFGVVLIVRGERAYGGVEGFDGSRVLTTFSHVYFLPIVPRHSFVRSETAEGVREVGIGIHVTSVLAAYARVWGTIWLSACFIGKVSGSRSFVLGTTIWIDLAVLFAVVLWGFALAGRVSATTRAQRRVYAKFAGVPVDVRRYSRAQAHDLREALEPALIEGARGHRFDYRSGVDARTAWREIAVHDDVRDPRYLEAAMTRARLESRWAPTRVERRLMSATHDRIWDKLESLS
jgi:hypothetical protein